MKPNGNNISYSKRVQEGDYKVNMKMKIKTNTEKKLDNIWTNK
jgi:hypothetical protein